KVSTIFGKLLCDLKREKKVKPNFKVCSLNSNKNIKNNQTHFGKRKQLTREQQQKKVTNKHYSSKIHDRRFSFPYLCFSFALSREYCSTTRKKKATKFKGMNKTIENNNRKQQQKWRKKNNCQYFGIVKLL
ncbi:hypothetical protein RFI_31575, partial [Reticulomyxa filosa]